MDEHNAAPHARDTEDSRLNREHGHALHNIFSIIIANAEMIGEESRGMETLQRRLDRIIAASRRGEQLVDGIRSLSKARHAPRPEPTEQASLPTAADGRLGRVLIVDDEPDVVEILRRYLERAGLQVHGFIDSREALNGLRREPLAYDLVITDLDMPNLCGIELREQLRTIRPDLPVIVITGHEGQCSGGPFSLSGVTEWLSKPINRNHLLDTVGRLLPPA